MTTPKMPELPLPGDEAVKIGHKYTIITVEPFTSEVQQYNGWRVTLDGGKDNLIAIPLWQVEIAGRKSKFGAFIVALGNNPDKWIGKTIEFVTWAERNRQIKVV